MANSDCPEQRQYDALCARMLNEYEQRDRDFLMYVTINAGLVGAFAYLVQKLLPQPGRMIVVAVAMCVLASIGQFFAKALEGSVRSFVYWQALMTAMLAKLELAILPRGTLGAYTQIVPRHPAALERFREIAPTDLGRLPQVAHLPTDLVDFRLRLGQFAVAFWWWARVFAVVVGFVGIVTLTPEGARRFGTALKSLWAVNWWRGL